MQSLVERGIMEVDGPPPDGSSRWSSRELDHGIVHLEGHRHVLSRNCCALNVNKVLVMLVQKILSFTCR